MIAVLALHAALTLTTPLVLAIGVNQGSEAPTQSLRYADDDAAEAVLLFDRDGSRSHLLTVLDAESQTRYPQLGARSQPPTLAELRFAVRHIAQRIDAERAAGQATQVIVWMSGHALRDAEGQTVFPLQQGSLSSAELIREIVEPLKAAHRIHLLLDTCFAASLVRARVVVEKVSKDTAEKGFFAHGVAAYPNVGALVGAGAGNRGYEWEEVRAGVFSAMVRAGLRGAADVDGDQRVDYREIAAFLAAASAKVEMLEARPAVQVWPPQIENDATLSLRDWLGPIVVLDQDLSAMGTVHVLDERGNWLLAGAFESGFRPALWLPQGRRLFLRSRGGEQALVAEAGYLQMGPMLEVATQQRSLVDESLRQGLFQLAYGPAFFRGYNAGAGQAPVVEPTGQARMPLASIASIGGASVLALGSFVVAALAVDAGLRFNNTALERPAREAFDQLLLFSALSTAGVVTATGLGVGAALLWPSDAAPE